MGNLTAFLAQNAKQSNLLRDKVTEEEIAKIVERWTGIPTARLMEGEREKLLHFLARGRNAAPRLPVPRTGAGQARQLPSGIRQRTVPCQAGSRLHGLSEPQRCGIAGQLRREMRRGADLGHADAG